MLVLPVVLIFGVLSQSTLASPQEWFQSIFKTPSVKGPLIDHDFSSFVKKSMKDGGVPGLSLAIVKPDGTTELGAWGNKTEDGDSVTPDVSALYSLFRILLIMHTCRLFSTSHLSRRHF